MVMMKRKRSAVTRPRKTTRRVRPRFSIPKTISTIGTKTYTFKRNATAGVLVPNTTTALGTISYTFSSLLANAEFSALFDRYRILKVVTKIWLRNGPDAQNANFGNNSWYPKLYWYRDTDDTSIPASIDAMRQVGRLKTRAFHPSRPITLVCVPNVLGVVYQGVGTTTYSPKYKQWIDFDNPGTLHLGWKYGIDNIPSTVGNLSPYAFDLEHTYYFQCRDVQ